MSRAYRPRPWILRRAVAVVRGGGIIAYPTESVYGLGCDPLNLHAVERLLALKQRDPAMGLILIADTPEALAPFLDLPRGRFPAKVLASWPGPVTWLLPAAAWVPGWLRGRHSTLAVRVTAEPLAAALCRALGGPLVSTSANRSGQPPQRTALGVQRVFGDAIDYVLHGAVGGLSRPTEIRDAASGRVLRSAQG